MCFQDDEAIQVYIEESLEHLSGIENDLLAIEEDGADINEELVNKVYRAAHSIKGGAGFMGFTKIKDLTHEMENLLGQIRARELVPTAAMINALLAAADALQSMIGDIAGSNQVDIAGHVEALQGMAVPSADGPTEANEDACRQAAVDSMCMMPHSCEHQLAELRQEGKYIYQIDLNLIEDLHQRGKTPIEFFQELQQCGVVVAGQTQTAALGTLDQRRFLAQFPFSMVFASVLKPEDINLLFEIDPNQIQQVAADNTLKPLDANDIPREAPPAFAMMAKAPLADTRPAAQADAAPTAPAMADTQSDVADATENTCAPPPATSTSGDTSLRVHVRLLDALMNLAGELVLSRNQLLQTITAADAHASAIAAQRIDLITTELQETIMLTRMQPIGNVFNKFSRVVRDLAHNLDKEVKLHIEGHEVELDKTIIENINDPLTHLVRNAVDHGIELPETRRQRGKSPTGHISLRAYHEAGQVHIEIADDGQGLDPARIAATAIRKGLVTEDQAQIMSDKDKLRLILMPGFSTAETLTDVSGRGVGMDVVKTNLDTLGGQIGIESLPGQGTHFSIKLPLTLAIIPSQIINVGGERYAIPQVNMEELVRIPAHQVQQRVERVGDAEVFRLRGDLLPLISLADVIGVQRTYIDPADKTAKPDRRQQATDLRCDTEVAPAEASCQVDPDPGAAQPAEHHTLVERRYHAASALNIVVVSAGAIRYGMTVDQLHDSEEIVVKPLGRHLKHCQGYAGATIMGDGRVALILDVTNIARMAGLSGVEAQHGLTAMGDKGQADIQQDAFTLLIFKFAPDEQFAVPLRQVERIEKIKLADIETIGDRQVLQYRGQSLPLLALDQVAKVKPLDAKEDVLVIVFIVQGHKVGILAEGPIDTLETAVDFDSQTLKQTGIAGSAIIDGVTTQLINVREMVKIMWPGWFTQGARTDPSRNADKTILFAEDSSFFRAQVKAFIEDEGYRVIDAEDGLSAWNLLNQHGDDIHLVLTDIDMPHLDGFSLSAKIRNDDRYAALPIVALTTLSSEKDVARGYAVGINDYQTKLDPDQLIQSIQKYI